MTNRNDDVNFNRARADLALANTDSAIQMIVATSERMDMEQAAAADAAYEATTKRNAERVEISSLIARMKRSLDESGHNAGSRKTLEAQIKANEAKLQRLAATTAKKAAAPARMKTSRMLAALAKTSARPHILQEVAIPKKYEQ